MQMVQRKKLDIFIEAHALEQVERMLGEAGFKGWSVFAGIEGSGAHGAWRQTGIGESNACLVIAIGGETACAAALDWLAEFFATYPGVATLSDVSVMRAERF
jgi:PII-like signaling protein